MGMITAINLILPSSLNRGDYMVMTLKVGDTIATLLIIPMHIYLLVTKNLYRNLWENH
jgi:hypothetical protein